MLIIWDPFKPMNVFKLKCRNTEIFVSMYGSSGLRLSKSRYQSNFRKIVPIRRYRNSQTKCKLLRVFVIKILDSKEKVNELIPQKKQQQKLVIQQYISFLLMNRFITKLDGSKVEFPLYIDDSNTVHKSKIGGYVTLCIYTLSAIYFFYNIYIWQAGFIPPISSVQQVVANELEYQLTNSNIILNGKINYDTIDYDLFDPNHMILQPRLQVFENNYKPINSTYDYKLVQREDKFYNVIIDNNILYASQTKQIELSLTFRLCNNQSVGIGRFCAPQYVIDEFIHKNQNFLTFTLKEQQFNTKTKQLDTISKNIDILFDKNTTQYRQLFCTVQETVIDDAILFSNSQILTYVNQFQSYDTFVSPQQLGGIKQDVYLIFYFRLSLLKSYQQIRYPKFNEVLANVSSIVSLLFYLLIIIHLINEKNLEFILQNEIISFYYPQFRNVTIEKNIFGKLTRAFYNKEQINTDSFQIFLQQMQAIAKKKLKITNIIYEISRIQFILQQIQTRKKIQQAHNIGIQLPLFKFKSGNLNNTIGLSCEIDPTANRECLVYQDFELLMKGQVINDILEDDDPYYLVNRVIF